MTSGEDTGRRDVVEAMASIGPTIPPSGWREALKRSGQRRDLYDPDVAKCLRLFRKGYRLED